MKIGRDIMCWFWSRKKKKLTHPRKITSERHACPCCGYKTLEERGVFSLCHICFWEDDPVQVKNPNYVSGANNVSLYEAQKNFKKFGASERELKTFVRKPSLKKDPNWSALPILSVKHKNVLKMQCPRKKCSRKKTRVTS